MNQREVQISTLVAAGFTTQETATQLGISTATVDRARARDDVKAMIEAKEAAGLSPRDTLAALMYSKDPNTRLRASVELAKLPEIPSEVPEPLPEGVVRVTREDHLGTVTTRVYPQPPWEEPEKIVRPGCIYGPDHGSPDNCGCTACRKARA